MTLIGLVKPGMHLLLLAAFMLDAKKVRACKVQTAATFNFACPKKTIYLKPLISEITVKPLTCMGKSTMN